MMSGILTKFRNLPIQYPLLRGMISYAIIWPTCSIVQEYIENGTSLDNADFYRAARFGLFGTFFMAPVFYGWMKYTNRFFKSTSLKTAVIRAAIEQISYSPLAMAYFFFGMSLLELKPVSRCVTEVKEKFWPTYKVGVLFWPTAQTLNFYFVPEQNRIIFVSAASFVWTVYLAHMKAKEPEKGTQKIKSRQGLDSSVNLSGEVVNTAGENVITSGYVVNTSGEITNTLGEKINVPDEIANMPGEKINMPEEMANTPGEKINVPEEMANTPRELLIEQEEYANTLSEMDMLTEAIDKSLIEVVEASSTEQPTDKVES